MPFSLTPSLHIHRGTYQHTSGDLGGGEQVPMHRCRPQGGYGQHPSTIPNHGRTLAKHFQALFQRNPSAPIAPAVRSWPFAQTLGGIAIPPSAVVSVLPLLLVASSNSKPCKPVKLNRLWPLFPGPRIPTPEPRSRTAVHHLVHTFASYSLCTKPCHQYMIHSFKRME